MLAMTLALLLQAGTPAARPPPSNADLPQWTRVPSAQEMTAAYPPGPRAENLAGSGVMDCTIGAAGELTACEVVSESLAGQGFGAAAVSLASRFQLPLKSPSGAAMAAEDYILGAVALRQVQDTFDRLAPAPSQPHIGQRRHLLGSRSVILGKIYYGDRGQHIVAL